MYYYKLWCDLKDSSCDLEFCRALKGYLGHLRDHALIESYRVVRRTFGFGPAGMGEFEVTISVRDLAQLERAQLRAASRDTDIEPRHRSVYELVTNLQTALYRDFPDDVRVG